MGNSPTRSVSYKPRMTGWEAWEQLWPEVREALAKSVISFDAYAVLRHQREHGLRSTLAWIERGNDSYAKRDFIKARGVKGRKGYVPAVPSTVISCRVPRLKK